MGDACMSSQNDIASCFSSSNGSSNSSNIIRDRSFTSNSDTSEGKDECLAKTNHPSFIEIPLTMDNNNKNNDEGRKKRPHNEEHGNDTPSVNKRSNNGLSHVLDDAFSKVLVSQSSTRSEEKLADEAPRASERQPTSLEELTNPQKMTEQMNEDVVQLAKNNNDAELIKMKLLKQKDSLIQAFEKDENDLTDRERDIRQWCNNDLTITGMELPTNKFALMLAKRVYENNLAFDSNPERLVIKPESIYDLDSEALFKIKPVTKMMEKCNMDQKKQVRVNMLNFVYCIVCMSLYPDLYSGKTKKPEGEEQKSHKGKTKEPEGEKVHVKPLGQNTAYLLAGYTNHRLKAAMLSYMNKSNENPNGLNTWYTNQHFETDPESPPKFSFHKFIKNIDFAIQAWQQRINAGGICRDHNLTLEDGMHFLKSEKHNGSFVFTPRSIAGSRSSRGDDDNQHGDDDSNEDDDNDNGDGNLSDNTLSDDNSQNSGCSDQSNISDEEDYKDDTNKIVMNGALSLNRNFLNAIKEKLKSHNFDGSERTGENSEDDFKEKFFEEKGQSYHKEPGVVVIKDRFGSTLDALFKAYKNNELAFVEGTKGGRKGSFYRYSVLPNEVSKAPPHNKKELYVAVMPIGNNNTKLHHMFPCERVEMQVLKCVNKFFRPLIHQVYGDNPNVTNFFNSMACQIGSPFMWHSDESVFHSHISGKIVYNDSKKKVSRVLGDTNGMLVFTIYELLSVDDQEPTGKYKFQIMLNNKKEIHDLELFAKGSHVQFCGLQAVAKHQVFEEEHNLGVARAVVSFRSIVTPKTMTAFVERMRHQNFFGKQLEKITNLCMNPIQRYCNNENIITPTEKQEEQLSKVKEVKVMNDKNKRTRNHNTLFQLNSVNNTHKYKILKGKMHNYFIKDIKEVVPFMKLAGKKHEELQKCRNQIYMLNECGIMTQVCSEGKIYNSICRFRGPKSIYYYPTEGEWYSIFEINQAMQLSQKEKTRGKQTHSTSMLNHNILVMHQDYKVVPKNIRDYLKALKASNTSAYEAREGSNKRRVYFVGSGGAASYCGQNSTSVSMAFSNKSIPSGVLPFSMKGEPNSKNKALRLASEQEKIVLVLISSSIYNHELRDELVNEPSSFEEPPKKDQYYCLGYFESMTNGNMERISAEDYNQHLEGLSESSKKSASFLLQKPIVSGLRKLSAEETEAFPRVKDKGKSKHEIRFLEIQEDDDSQVGTCISKEEWKTSLYKKRDFDEQISRTYIDNEIVPQYPDLRVGYRALESGSLATKAKKQNATKAKKQNASGVNDKGSTQPIEVHARDFVICLCLVQVGVCLRGLKESIYSHNGGPFLLQHEEEEEEEEDGEDEVNFEKGEYAIPLQEKRLKTLIRICATPSVIRSMDRQHQEIEQQLRLDGTIPKKESFVRLKHGVKNGDTSIFNTDLFKNTMFRAIITCVLGTPSFISFLSKNKIFDGCSILPTLSEMPKLNSALTKLQKGGNNFGAAIKNQQYKKQIPINDYLTAQEFFTQVAEYIENDFHGTLQQIFLTTKDAEQQRKVIADELCAKFSMLVSDSTDDSWKFVVGQVIACVEEIYEDGIFGTVSINNVVMASGSIVGAELLSWDGITKRNKVGCFLSDVITKAVYDKIMAAIQELTEFELDMLCLFKSEDGIVRNKTNQREINAVCVEHMFCKFSLILKGRMPERMHSSSTFFKPYCYPYKYTDNKLNASEFLTNIFKTSQQAFNNWIEEEDNTISKCLLCEGE